MLERVARAERLAVIEQVAGEEQIGFGGAPARQLLGTRALELEGRDRLAQLRERSLLVDRKSTRLNSSHVRISYAVFCLKKKRHSHAQIHQPDPPRRSPLLHS